MLRVFYSNHLENLVDSLVETIRHEKARTHQSAFDPVRVVVPNWNLETFLKLQIAERTGLAAALKFERLERFMASLLPEDTDVELLTAELLQSLTLDALSDPTFLSQEGLEPVHGFIFAAGDDQDAVARRRFQLAGRLADLFREYSYSRETMLEAWRKGERVIEEPAFQNAERWQRLVWLELFGEDGRIEQLAEHRETKYVRITQILEHFDAPELQMPAFVHLFGISYVATAYEQIFWELGQDRQLNIYALNPCRELWEDVVGNPDEEEQLLSSKSVQGGLLDFSGESAFWEPEKHPPALRLWGRAGRDNARMLNRLCQYNFIDKWQDFEPDSTLEHLQHDILTLTPEREEPVPGLDDDSIQILACPSVEREVEIISDEIWALVRGKRDTWGEGEVDFNDIAVIVNHEMREAYQTQIESVFRNAHGIPFNIIDVDATHHSTLVEALDLLYKLPFGKFRRRDLLELMTHANVLASYPDADADQWVAWCDSLNVVHGADHSEHDDTYIEEDILNWDQGMRRLALGSFMAGEPSGVDELYEHGGFDYLPHEVPEDAAEGAAQFVSTARSLIADARACRDRLAPLSDWCTVMADMLDTYISAARDEDEYEIMRARGLLLDIAELDLTEREVPYRIAYEFVAEQLAGLEVQRGSYLTDGVVVSSFLPMRPIPFKAVFVTGMGEGKFPTADTRDPLDLRLARWQEGDVYKRDQDKYMFLETLISTRDRFYMSYVSRDSRTGDPLEPASTVREMQFILEQGYLGSDKMDANIVEHPLRRFDERYFDDDNNLPRLVYPEARREAGVRAIQRSLESHCREQDIDFPDPDTFAKTISPESWASLSKKLGVYPAPERSIDEDEPRKISVSLRHLSSFLSSPLQGFAQYVLGLRRDEEEDMLAVDDEDFQSDFLAELSLLRDVFDDVARSAPIDQVDDFATAYDALSHRGKIAGDLPSGLFGSGERPSHLNVLETWLQNLPVLGFPSNARLQRKRIGRADEFADIDDVLDSLSLRVDTEHGPLEVEIYGETNLLHLDASGDQLPGSIYLMSGSSMKDRYVLNGFFDYLAMAATGVLEDAPGFLAASNPRLRLVADGNKKQRPETYVTRFGPLTQERATAFLEALVAEMFGRAHDYLMPIEPILDWASPDEERSIAELVDYYRGSPWKKMSSQYGPIHDWKAFEPPADAEAIAEQRFGLLFELMREDADE
ncbi:MAG: exodeoxyribonuclease V subunit gamma [Myxococcota bacterium]